MKAMPILGWGHVSKGPLSLVLAVELLLIQLLPHMFNIQLLLPLLNFRVLSASAFL